MKASKRRRILKSLSVHFVENPALRPLSRNERNPTGQDGSPSTLV